MKKYILMFCIISLIASVSAISPSFNGNFSQGATLFTDSIHIVNSTIFGKDVYPIKTDCTTKEVCSKYAYTYEKVCTRYYSDICKRYGYHYERQCIRYDTMGNCRGYKAVKISDGCVSYRNDLCSNYKKVKIPGECLAYRTQVLCTGGSPIGCIDPYTGIYTNQLSLRNFKYSLDGITWNRIPYNSWIDPAINIEEADVIFKVDIPSVCTPSYDINNSIQIIFQ